MLSRICILTSCVTNNRVLSIAFMISALTLSNTFLSPTTLGRECITCQVEDTLLGDAWGYRSSLEEKGISLGLVYTLDGYSNVRGGLDTSNATKFRGNIDLTASLDLEQLGLWQGAEFFIYGQSGHGEGVTGKHTGDLQVISNIDDRRLWQISEVWLQQHWMDSRLRLKVGKQDANADFAGFGYCNNYVNSSFCYPPNVQIPTFPDPALGAALFAEPGEMWQIGAGIYDGGPKGGTTGFNTSFDGRDGYNTVAQVDIRPFESDLDLPGGTYRVGTWRHSGNVEEITGNATPKQYDDNYGIYVVADQSLYRFDEGKANPRGIAAFFQYAWAPHERNEIELYYGGGLSCKGWIPGRDKDLSGIGVGRAVLSSRVRTLERRTYETMLEIFHMFYVFPGFTIQPDVQFIFNPNGNGRNAIAVGTRMMLAF